MSGVVMAPFPEGVTSGPPYRAGGPGWEPGRRAPGDSRGETGFLAEWGHFTQRGAILAEGSDSSVLRGSVELLSPGGTIPGELMKSPGQPLAGHFLRNGKVSATPENCPSPEAATWEEA